MTKPKYDNSFRLRRLEVKNFKALDRVVLEFPRPQTDLDADVFVIGSENGIGKTSVLEAIAFLFVAPWLKEGVYGPWSKFINVPEKFIRGRAKEAVIVGEFENGKGRSPRITRAKCVLSRSGTIKLQDLPHRETKPEFRTFPEPDIGELVILSLFGIDPGPLEVPGLMYFNEFRKIPEGSPELGALVAAEGVYRRHRRPYDIHEMIPGRVKIEILKALMGRSSLFEGADDRDSADVMEFINELMLTYANGRVEQVRPSDENTLDIRIAMEDSGETISFDGLSSGQKEIISTLFLIWRQTRGNPRVVLIDEPELHLNMQWHREFVRKLAELAPENQYIIATHSEAVFASVAERNRALLSGGDDG